LPETNEIDRKENDKDEPRVSPLDEASSIVRSNQVISIGHRIVAMLEGTLLTRNGTGDRKEP
jgi:hypothetical protein